MSVRSIFVTAPRGLVPLLADELRDLGARKVREEPAGCRVRGPLPFAYRICMWSRLASRVLVHLADLRTPDADALYEGVHEFPWEDHADPAGTLLVDFAGVGAGIDNTHYGAQRTKDAIVDRLRERTGGRPNVEHRQPDLRIHAFVRGAGCSLSVDLAGDSLHRRGYRIDAGGAPLKENVAAGLLRLGGWIHGPPKPNLAAVVDPMAGAGTIAIEAAMVAADLAPGRARQLAFERGWRSHEPATWATLCEEADARAVTGRAAAAQVAIIAADPDPDAQRAIAANAGRAGVGELIRAVQRPLSGWADVELPSSGLLVTNPPHGERLGAKSLARDNHRALGRLIEDRFADWTTVVLTTDDELRYELGVRGAAAHPIDNGPIECVAVVRTHGGEDGDAEAPAPSGPSPAEPFINRLRKNLAKLEPWTRRERIECYRIYDADIPEFNVAIDRYGDLIHVQEFEAPDTVDAGGVSTRIEAILDALPVVLGVPPEAIRLKRRRRQRKSSQYQKMGDRGRRIEVREGGHRFAVNLDDHLDTGLFLDHRRTRGLIERSVAGGHFLNLFGYTGTATVYAAAGGAKSTTTVDLSNTYLDWAEDNLRLNDLYGEAHELIRDDARRFLARERRRWDLIFLDPPTYSRSKAMDGDFDVVRDHVELIDAAMARLHRSGMLLFSTNARRFRLDPRISDNYAVEELTKWSLPRDFPRRPPIHQLWRIEFRKTEPTPP
jgi:23S rRNA (guanine2445-N2)-methyltransferase / 23S rRNA (guanine2069-N7)-methyltransferase